MNWVWHKRPRKLNVAFTFYPILALAFLFALFVHAKTSIAQLAPELLGNYTLSEGPLPIIFPKAGVELNIPANFIDRPKSAAASLEHSTLLLMAQLPDITGRNVNNNQEFGRTSASGDNPLVTILLQDKREAEWDLAAVSSSYERNRPEYSYVDLGETFALRGRRQIPPNFGRWHWKDIYSKENNGRLSTSIICKGEGTVSYPRCDHIFLYKKIIIKMNYSARYLQLWKSIEENFRHKIKSW